MTNEAKNFSLFISLRWQRNEPKKTAPVTFLKIHSARDFMLNNSFVNELKQISHLKVTIAKWNDSITSKGMTIASQLSNSKIELKDH